ncbi:MAG: T9SS type A sorting domain-containing protein [Brumimicrobium sp.]|nr:T9SS type A sorting domain-containing protein [Brumimicrobium sp.]
MNSRIFSGIVLILGLAQFPFSQTTCFSTDNSFIFDGANNAKSIAKGDFNNDGLLDIIMGKNLGAAADPNLKYAIYIENNGNRSFNAPVEIMSGSRVQDVAAADINNDGNLDILVVNFNMNRLAIIYGNGDGTFQTPIGYTTSFGPNSIAVGDFNNDGLPDVAVAGNGNNIDFFFNNISLPGTLTSIAPFVLPGGVNPSDIIAMDLDLDGNMDVATSNSGGASVSVIFGDGVGGFSLGGTYAADLGTSGISSGFFNNDIYPDIAVTNENANTITVFINDGTGSLSTGISYSAGAKPLSIDILDFNNDGKIDLAAINADDNTISLYEGNSDGTFQNQKIIYAKNYPTDIVTGDFDTDGNDDIIHSCLIGAVMPAYFGDGSGDFDLGNMVNTGNSPKDISVNDFDGDGKEDYVVVNYDDNTASIYLNDGAGNYTFSQSLTTGSHPISVASGNIFGSGKNDIVVANYSDGTATLFQNLGGGSFASSTLSVNANPLKVRIGNFNGDADLDLFVLNEASQITVLPGIGSGSFGAQIIKTSSWLQPKDITIGDINGDGYDDFAVPFYGSNKVSIYKSDGVNGFVNADKNTAAKPIAATFVNLNSDGKPELVVVNNTANSISLFANNGAGVFANATNIPATETEPLSVIAGDFNGDGFNDIAVTFHVSTGSTGSLRIFKGNGTNSGAGALTYDATYLVGMNPVSSFTKDINGDGGLDILVVNELHNYVSVMLSIGGIATITPSGSTTICSNETLTLTSSPAQQYLWSNGATTQSINVTTSGSYFVTTSAIGGGCSSTSNDINVTVLPAPTINYSGNTEICENASTTITVSGANTYQWSDGLGVGNSKTLNPSADKTYTVIGEGTNGCKDTLEIEIVVTPLPDATFNTLNSEYCEMGSPVNLVPNQAGGTFSGPGVSGSTFEPNQAGVGIHTISYSISDNGCVNSSSQIVEVSQGGADASFTILNSNYCQDASDITLVPIISGGSFSGPGVSGNIFSPGSANIGLNTITYTVTDDGCVGISNQTVIIDEKLSADFSGLQATYCLNDSPVTLIPDNVGGNFTGNGISGDQFTPNSGGVGTYNITYTLTNGSCTSSISKPVQVESLPNANFSGLASSYCVTAGTVTLTPSVGGGSFSGPGVSSNTFSPSVAGVGTHSVTYQIIGGNGCTNSVTKSVEINGNPDASFTGLGLSYCLNENAVTLTPSVGGGIFSGSGMNGNIFDPASAGQGNHTISYFVNTGGCSSFSSQTVDVHPLPNPSFTGLNPTYCVNDPSVILSPIQNGGSFTGPGVSGNTFKPINAGVGVHTIKYKITNVFGCIDSSLVIVEVLPLPDANFTGLATLYCLNSDPVILTPDQSGGTFSGPGIINGNTFDPSIAGTGNHTIEYEIINGGCQSQFSQLVEVINSPDATFSGLALEYCKNNPVITLSPIQGGGTFSGDGIDGSTFDPNIAGIGPHTITYTINAGNGCSDVTSQTVTINPIPDASFTGLQGIICVNSSPSTMVPTSPGGNFSGPGISGNSFDPSIAGIGSHTISYTVIDINGCSNSSSQITIVQALPDASFSGLDPEYCVDASSVTLIPAINGGSFSGDGVFGSTFSPGTAGVGPHSVTYTVTDGFGCVNNSSENVIINGLPDASFTGLASDYCVNTAAVTLVPVIGGGNFSGDGININSFDPSIAGEGIHNIIYTVIDGNNCSNTSSQSVTINGLPDATFSGLPATMCINAPDVTLVPTVSGGIFSGNGVLSSTFSPTNAGLGIHSVQYSLTDANGCSNDYSQSVEVIALPDATFSGLNTAYCSNDAAVNLLPTQGGGIFSGDGIIGNSFDPYMAGTGTHIITYTINGGNGCIDVTTQTVQVNGLPDASFVGLASMYCIDASAVTMIPTQVGGAFSGNGVSGNLFNPASAGIGQHSIVYSIIDGNGCSSTSSFLVTVDNTYPDANFTGLDATYCVNGTYSNLTPNENGGTFIGSGMTGNIFDPQVSGEGTFTITYTITGGNTCSSTSSQTIEVYGIPDANFSGLNPAYCLNASSTTLSPITGGGTFSGDGVISQTFDPSMAGQGTHQISYTITDANLCTNSTTQTVVVNSLPDATFSGFYPIYCLYGTPATFIPTIAGGTFSGDGMSGDIFTPNNAGLGIHLITYTVTSVDGCTDSHSESIEVTTSPNPNFSGLGTEYCASAPAVTLTPIQGGGVFSGNGIVGNTFDPSIAGPGTHIITYDISDGSGCDATATETVIVDPLPDSGFTTLPAQYCLDAPAIDLIPNQMGGAFSGPGIFGGKFYPSIVGVGTYTISYSIIDGNSCAGSSSQTIQIVPNPDATFSGLSATYCELDDEVIMTPLENGGIFTGNGVNGNIFDPQLAGPGNHMIVYTIDNGVGCSNTYSVVVKVYAMPDAHFIGLADVYCSGDAPSTLVPVTYGGVYTSSSSGVSGNSFYPSIAGIGVNVVTYTVTTINGCVNSFSDTTVVKTSPSTVITVNGSNLIANENGTGVTYQWWDCQNQTIVTGATDRVFHVLATGSYAVIVDNGVCADTSICVNVNVTGLDEEIVNSNNIIVYPNPNNGKFTIKADFEGSISIYNSLGKIIYQGDHATGEQLINLNEEIESGMYILRFQDTSYNFVYKNLIIRN